MMPRRIPGALHCGDDTCVFTVWAPFAEAVAVRLLTPVDRVEPLSRDEHGYHSATVAGVPIGAKYYYSLDGKVERSDPASRHQPEGVHGPSEVCSRSFDWTDEEWRGIPLQDYVLYELHVGAFTQEGTFDAIIPRLRDLRSLGITAIELMPVAQFPGERNWGYDGSYHYAVQHSYGGPEALKRLVNACHSAGMAAVLDVVYNHFGPEGNYAGEFGPYFTARYQTPWGRAVNFDGPGSDEVRRFFLENARYWLQEIHFDALRLDALHAILDTSASPFLAELSAEVKQACVDTGRRMYLIGESDLNDPRLIRERQRGGLGLDAQWSDDFHHALHVLLTGERTGYYADFGAVQQLAAAWHEGYAYSGQYSVFRQRRHGAPASDLPACRFVVCAQNHDQVGNRAVGDRLSTCVSFESLKLAAACVILSPHVPLLFMGEEYGEKAPFPYFVDHSDPALIEAVRKGRREEFEVFHWEGELPDPQDEGTFLSAILGWEGRNKGRRRILLSWYAELLRLRRGEPLLTLSESIEEHMQPLESSRVLLVKRASEQRAVLLAFNFGDASYRLDVPANRRWAKRLDSTDAIWLGPGNAISQILDQEAQPVLHLGPKSVVLLSAEGE